MHLVVFLTYFIYAAFTLLASLDLMIKFSLPYNKGGRANELCDFIPVFLRVFCGLNTLCIMPVIFFRESLKQKRLRAFRLSLLGDSY